MKTRLLFLLPFLMICLAAVSCSKSSSGCSGSEFDQKEAAMNEAGAASVNAQITYQTDQTEANCIAYRDAYNNYLNKLSAFIDCLDEVAVGNWNIVYANALKKRDEIPC